MENLSEPVAWHIKEIWEREDGLVNVFERTNDDEDRGYPTKYESWSWVADSVEKALKITGYTRQGIGCKVYVYVNGKEVTCLEDIPDES